MTYKRKKGREELLVFLVALTAFPTMTLNSLGLDKVNFVWDYFNKVLNF